MSSLDDLEQRVAALEAEQPHLRQEVAAARALAAGADRDVAEYRAEMRGQTRLLSALRETQVEQGAELAEVKAGIGHIVQLLEGLTGGASAE